ncbi:MULTISPECIES: flavin reductase family protein [unclassified Mycobacterium]|uniref:flavin reductase family protein n=1 Tax=unclassified Mycobacterium TaxID=2642494 RepID=UPI0029C70B10|nr:MULTISPECIES: flavin reductase family protein [unclassified Mycobacterium]
MRKSPASSAVDTTVASSAMRATLGRFCTGVTIVTAAAESGPAGFTCQAFSAVSLEPPLVLLCPAKTSTSWPKISRAQRFSINVLGSGHEELCRDFAVSAGDKFAGRSWHVSARTDAPILADAVAVIDCVIEAEHDAGDHTVVIARVLGLEHTDDEPLLFFRGRFHRLSDRSG